MQWQPIETAPKDGTSILVSNGRWRDIAYWAAFARFNNITDSMDVGPAWCGRDCDDPYYSYALDPTHWMPLPPPPAETK